MARRLLKKFAPHFFLAYTTSNFIYELVLFTKKD